MRTPVRSSRSRPLRKTRSVWRARLSAEPSELAIKGGELIAAGAVVAAPGVRDLLASLLAWCMEDPSATIARRSSPGRGPSRQQA